MQKGYTFESVIFYGEQVFLVNLSLRDHGTSFTNLSVLIGDLLLGSYSFPGFVIENTSGGDFNIRLVREPPFAKYEVDVVVSFSLVMVEGGNALHFIPFTKLFRKFGQYLLWVIGGVDFLESYNQLSGFDTRPLCSASFELLLTFLCKIIPKRILYGTVGSVEIFLSCVTCDI